MTDTQNTPQPPVAKLGSPLEGAVSIYRKWSDVSAKVKAAAAGGVTTGGVTSIIAAINPDWHPAAWLVGLITIAGALLSAYAKGETVKVSTIQADGTELVNAVVDLPELDMPDWVQAQLDAQDSVGADEAEQDDAAGRHEAV